MRHSRGSALFGIIQVSIHASVRDATCCGQSRYKDNRRFNPRIREGCDQLQYLISFPSQRFNPRIREGCDHHRADPPVA